MRKILAITLLTIISLACKQQSKDDENTGASVVEMDNTSSIPEGQVELRGEFIVYEDIIVLNTTSKIHEVERNDVALQLVDRTNPLKKNEYDAPIVTLQGKLKPNPKLERGEEGWPEVFTIHKIIEINPALESNVITTGSKVELKDIK
ncbi:hypothetical protein [Nonlabens tegetincola]|uniref:hypothetical protein n=1 Tax=Nonlabens tegetincola TaxID=323273 RepID=UPI0005A5D118|nr:hypothetical protein [Nonlabens tegetincola]